MNTETITRPRLHRRLRKKLNHDRRTPPLNTAADTLAPETDLVLARFRLRARLRLAWLQTLWSDRRGPDGVPAHPGEVDQLLADADAPEAQRAWLTADESVRSCVVELKGVEAALRQHDVSGGRFALLAKIFGVDPGERDLLECCFAVAVDPSLARICAYLHDNPARPYVSEDLAARLYGHGRFGGWSAEAAMFRWQLLKRCEAPPGEPSALVCDPQIRDWILGRHSLDESMVGAVRIQRPAVPLSQWPVKEAAAWITQAIEKNPGAPLRIVVSGNAGSGRKTFAAAVAQQLGLRLLVIAPGAAEEGAWASVFLRAQRQAFLDAGALAWTGDAAGRRWPLRTATFPVQFCLCLPGAEPPPDSGLFEQRVLLPSTTAADRVRLWREHVPAAVHWPEKQLQQLAAEHAVSPGDIVQAARSGVAEPVDAARCARQSARDRFQTLVQRLECPFGWDDLVIPAAVREALESLAFEARHRHAFWEKPSNRRLFAQGRGLAALFSGVPGTGKTMAAQVIAADLGQDLFRVNVAHLVSKWVGDTAKHIDALLRDAAALDAVIFFDEADAVFARRSTEMRDAQDRFANTDTAHLLQAIENHPGVVLLATNLKGNIDPAFFRRLRYVVEFPKPDPALQRSLWTKLIGALAGADAGRRLAPMVEALSDSVDVTGAQIKFAVLDAVFLAQADREPMQTRHLLAGLNRELGKEGRVIGQREREAMQRCKAK